MIVINLAFPIWSTHIVTVLLACRSLKFPHAVLNSLNNSTLEHVVSDLLTRSLLGLYIFHHLMEGPSEPPSNSAAVPGYHTWSAALEKVLKPRRNYFGHFFRVRSKLKPSEVFKCPVWPISTSFDKLAHNSGTKKAAVLRKSVFDSSFSTLSHYVFRFDQR